MGIVSSAIDAAGTTASAAGDILSGYAGAASQSYQSQVAKNNAEIARANAGITMAGGDIASTGQGLKNRAVIGATRAGQGASGIDPNTGSAVQVQQSEAELGTLDALTIRSNAARKAYGYQVQATQDIAQASLYRKAASQSRLGGWLNAAATFLGSSASTSSPFASAAQNAAESEIGGSGDAAGSAGAADAAGSGGAGAAGEVGDFESAAAVFA